MKFWWGTLSNPELNYNLILTYVDIDSAICRVGVR